MSVLTGGELLGLHHLDICVLEWVQSDFLRRLLSLPRGLCSAHLCVVPAPGVCPGTQFSQAGVRAAPSYQLGLYLAVGTE